MTNISIINIGDELLIGQVVNTNAARMGQLLSAAGFHINDTYTVSDSEEGIRRSLTQALSHSEVVLMSGGLGPTKDDITKKVLCEYFDSPLAFHAPAYVNMERLFTARGFSISEANEAQAMLPQKCQPLPNLNGTAFGMWFDTEDKKVVVSMPGVPFEMLAILEWEVLPRLQQQFSPTPYFQHTIMTQGMGESMIAERIAPIEEALPPEIHLAYLPRPGLVRLRLSAQATHMQAIKQKILAIGQEIEHRLGPEIVYGHNEADIAEVVGQMLLAQKSSLSTAESCTGGAIAARISAVAGASQYFKGSIISYSNAVKTHNLGVAAALIDKHGAVSHEVVQQMLQGALQQLHTDYAIAVSGIAGPTGGSTDKPVGTTYIGVIGPQGSLIERFQFGEHRGRNIDRSTLTALNMLRRLLLSS